MKITYKLIRKAIKRVQVENEPSIGITEYETGETGLTWAEAKKASRGTDLTLVRETIAAPTTAQEVAAAPLAGSRVTK